MRVSRRTVKDTAATCHDEKEILRPTFRKLLPIVAVIDWIVWHSNGKALIYPY